MTTLGPNDRWNAAALGIHAPAGESVVDEADEADGTEAVTARTYGRTRTWRNFRERGGGYVQFTRDPVTFVEAALSVSESEEPILPSADAWVRVAVERRGETADAGTQVVTWALEPVESAVDRQTVPTTNRGYYAVVEATVAASRLDVDAYDRSELLDRLAYFESVVETAGGRRERAAFDRVRELVDAEW